MARLEHVLVGSEGLGDYIQDFRSKLVERGGSRPPPPPRRAAPWSRSASCLEGAVLNNLCCSRGTGKDLRRTGPMQWTVLLALSICASIDNSARTSNESSAVITTRLSVANISGTSSSVVTAK